MNTKQLTLFMLWTNPDMTNTLSPCEWNQVLHACYRVNHVARFFGLLKHHNLEHHIPDNLLWHFTSAWKHYNAQQRDFHFTLSSLAKQLKAFKVDVILLKGAAYAEQGQLKSAGRVFSDIDIFVDKQYLSSAEFLLKWNGWQTSKTDEYDQLYFREWMHELPPMHHKQLPMTLDVHHHLTPIISSQYFDISLLKKYPLQNARGPFKLLNPHVQSLHTCIHMLTNDDLSNVFRDLLDLFFAINETDELSTLIDIAQATNQQDSVYRGLRLCQTLFNLNYAPEIIATISRSGIRAKLIDSMYRKIIHAQINGLDSVAIRAIKLALVTRAHLLKMPTTTLIKHSLHKLITLTRKQSPTIE